MIGKRRHRLGTGPGWELGEVLDAIMKRALSVDGTLRVGRTYPHPEHESKE